MPAFYDTHAHLDFPEFAEDLDLIVARAQAAGITRVISIGTDLASSQKAIQLSERYEGVFAAVGWHPSDAMAAPEDVRSALRDLARHPKVVAIGETGLDYYRLPSQREGGSIDQDGEYKRRQSNLFLQHLEVAAATGLNCVVHQRAALDDTLAVMETYRGRVRGQFHCFADDAHAMKRVLGLGSLVSFTGILTFKNAQNVRDTLAATPPGHFMLETDSPYLAPIPYRGKRCEPAYVKEISEKAAELKGCSLEELSMATRRTAHEFFPKLR